MWPAAQENWRKIGGGLAGGAPGSAGEMGSQTETPSGWILIAAILFHVDDMLAALSPVYDKLGLKKAFSWKVWRAVLICLTA